MYLQIQRTFCSSLPLAITITSTITMFSRQPQGTREDSSPTNTMKPTDALLASTRIRQAARISCRTMRSTKELSETKLKASTSRQARSIPIQASTLGLRWLKLSLLCMQSPAKRRITALTRQNITFLKLSSCEEFATRTGVLFSSAIENQRQMTTCSNPAPTTLAPAASPTNYPYSSPISATTELICSSYRGSRMP